MIGISSAETTEPSDQPRKLVATPVASDRIFRALSTSAASVALVIIVATLVFLINESRPALSSSGIWHFFTSSTWDASAGRFGVMGLLLGTVIIATLAMAVALPLGLAMALFINEYAPPRASRVLTSVVDLLAALPSLIFGMWGRDAFAGRLGPVARWFGDHLVAIPLFRIDDGAVLGSSSFVAGIVVGVMILPIITSISRDVMAQVPREQCEGALALGGTRSAMIRSVVLPFGKKGIIGAALLAFGRALGETIAVAIIIAPQTKVNWHVLEKGAGSIAAQIAIRFGEASAVERSGLVATGLALMMLTITVSIGARRLVVRGGTR